MKSICRFTFLINKVQAQNTTNFLALLNLDEQNITCITSDSQKAIAAIYPLDYASQVKGNYHIIIFTFRDLHIQILYKKKTRSLLII